MTSLDPAALDALPTRARRDVDERLLPSCRLALALDGDVVLEDAWADPATGRSFAYLTNGRDQHVLRVRRRTPALAGLAAVCAR